MKVLPGEPYPLGATYDGRGTNFSIFSEAAESVRLCLFCEKGEETQIQLPEVTGYCWHCYLTDIQPGQRYGYRILGQNDPDKGLRCNPAKLLLDPYAKAIDGDVQWTQAVFPYNFADPAGPVNTEDSAPYVPKSVVINPFYDWRNDRPPMVALHETIIYETHVRGFTINNKNIPEEIRGSFLGLAHPVMIEYLQELGITAVELMPVHQFVQDPRLLQKGLRNYWGYNTIGFFAPHNGYAASGRCCQQVNEFKQMVQALHEAGIEIILDVVYNHTAEGNHLGPILCFKGIDNAAYYRLMDDNPKYYLDFTATGNTLNMRHPQVLQLIMDSLRYWVTEMHVDGFRFDLAATLARELHDVDRLSSFFDVIHQDPVISQVKLIAEPWDVGEGGYQVGKFPPRWLEWNGKYRDSVRKYWIGDHQTLGEFSNRFAGSSDLYEFTGRRPYASVNFITAHDGFTLQDLVSYSHKHNEANGEDNKDGMDDNFSCNCGVEGPTDDPAINEIRSRLKRSMLATLFLSQGMPMLLGGDEFGRTQWGNNNAYCQDNEISYYDWEKIDEDLLNFVKQLTRMRLEHPVFRRWRWFQGQLIWGTNVTDIGWFQPNGKEMDEHEWDNGSAKSLQVFLNGRNLPGLAKRGDKPKCENFLILFNAGEKDVIFKLPERKWGQSWKRILDTVEPALNGEGPYYFQAEHEIVMKDRSVVVLQNVD